MYEIGHQRPVKRQKRKTTFVTADHLVEIEKKINDLLQKGWALQGTVFVKLDTTRNVQVLAQQMTKLI